MTTDTKAETTSFGDLTPGIRYRVELHDCCVEGHFDATFVCYRYGEDEDDRDEKYEALFDIGAIGPSWGALTFTALS